MEMACRRKRSAVWIHEHIVTRLLDHHLRTAHERLQPTRVSTRAHTTTHHDECDCNSEGYDLVCSLAKLLDPLPDSVSAGFCELDPSIAGRLRWLAECTEPHVEWLWAQLEHFQYWHLARVVRTRADLRQFLDAPPPARPDLAGIQEEDWINLDVDVGTLFSHHHQHHLILSYSNLL